MIKIAILGLGTVGTGVVKVVEANTAPIQHKLGQPLSVKTALVRKLRADPYQHLMTENFREIEHDGEIRVVVETIGGVEAAYEYTRRCLMAGKHVVTANKQLVAEHGCELLELARKNHVNYLFEASVGGGIPVLHPLTQCMAANRVDEIYGILNGTTNFILTKMVKEGASFAEVLKLAQEKGYAEADPTADVEGIDAGRKICILADLAFGHQVDPAQVPMEGITGIDLKDVEIAGTPRLPHQAAGPLSAAGGRPPHCVCGAPPDLGGEPHVRCERCVQRGGGPGQRHRRGHVLRQGCGRAAHRLCLCSGCDRVSAGGAPPAGDRLERRYRRLCLSADAEEPLVFPGGNGYPSGGLT